MLNLSSYNGNQYVGVFSCANENISLIPVDSSETLVNDMESALQVKCIKTNIASTNLIGALVAEMAAMSRSTPPAPIAPSCWSSPISRTIAPWSRHQVTT